MDESEPRHGSAHGACERGLPAHVRAPHPAVPPVVENGALVGIVTLGDLRSLGADTESDEANKIRVDAALHTSPITVTTETTLVDAARLMLKHKFSGLPVLSASDQSLVGIITESDILRAFIADETP